MQIQRVELVFTLRFDELYLITREEQELLNDSWRKLVEFELTPDEPTDEDIVSESDLQYNHLFGL